MCAVNMYYATRHAKVNKKMPGGIPAPAFFAPLQRGHGRGDPAVK